MSNRRVLVVGTSSDYIDIINGRFPDRAIFITDVNERARATEVSPGSKDELLCDLNNPEQIVAALRVHLKKWGLKLSGITCFDCESMLLTSFIAGSFGLNYPSTEAVMTCRSKYTCKKIWRKSGPQCPGVDLAHKASDVVDFMQRIGSPVVLKPITGSGSELIFLCSTEDECLAAFNTMQSKMSRHCDSRMYASCICDGKRVDPRKVFVIEEFVQGDEYSCDFILDGNDVEIIRIARKIPDPMQVFGTTLAYLLPSPLPKCLEDGAFRRQLNRAAVTLGLDRAICMLDFVVRDGQAFMIELSPRPGGDCLPPLILSSCGKDILGIAIDFAEGDPCIPDKSPQWRRLAGVRLFATHSGQIKQIDSSSLLKDHRVIECHLKRKPGHRVVLPPNDYDSRILGHVIFEPSGSESVENESIEIASKLNIEMMRPLCTTISQS
ncbi:MAG: ATP-grasp domain-containing protein [Phycisphaerae bacterium]|nr:ATP-grasp domain-containing protein [Phycisphaerae bacterium]